MIAARRRCPRPCGRIQTLRVHGGAGGTGVPNGSGGAGGLSGLLFGEPGANG
ncbi:hypothetical protein BCGT_0911 [Mycobacterium tuberculosis variant bovis BCG str. ATCC 35743]|nr:hypothetical protein BCGT_0911 [Mycobacterium tuberculosis variant bovis BCG str. ATCC 35743]